MQKTIRLLRNLTALVATTLLPALVTAQSCTAKSGNKPLAVVELYTSESCSSCPPADKWLGKLKGNANVLAMSFHVNYWNHLGWKDPYATKATTERQYLLQRAMNASHVYTPQVVLNGKDFRQWHHATPQTLSILPATDAPRLSLQRNGKMITATVDAAPNQSSFAGYWVVLQDGVSGKVLGGENAGETLSHEHVVSVYSPVAAWNANTAHTLQFNLAITPAAQAGSKERIAFVVTDSSLTKPLQAVVLNCT